MTDRRNFGTTTELISIRHSKVSIMISYTRVRWELCENNYGSEDESYETFDEFTRVSVT